MLSSMKEIIFDVKAFKTVPDVKNLSKKQSLDTASLTLCLRQIELEKQKLTSLEEDRELELLKHPIARPYAKRIAYLEYKTERTKDEERELALLGNPETCAYAKRMLELEKIQNKNFIEDIEDAVLANPTTRPYHDQVVNFSKKLINLNLNSALEERACFLLVNKYSIPRSNEILQLEMLPRLNLEQITKLSNDYLIRICRLPEKYASVVSSNNSHALLQLKQNCISKKQVAFPAKVINFYTVKAAFDTTANQLTEKYYAQLFAKGNAGNGLFDKTSPERMNAIRSDRVQTIMKEKAALVSNILQRIFFDFDYGFCEITLKQLSKHLLNEIINQKLELSSPSTQALFDKIQDSLNRIEDQVESRCRQAW